MPKVGGCSESEAQTWALCEQPDAVQHIAGSDPLQDTEGWSVQNSSLLHACERNQEPPSGKCKYREGRSVRDA